MGPCGPAVKISAAPSRIAANTIPAIPAIVVSTMDSDSICAIMSRGFAPMARRIPISCVRSRTIIHIMLPTPITPDKRVPVPTTSARRVIPANTLSTISNISDMLK